MLIDVQRLLAAVHAIYFAAVWSPDRECDAQKLWTELRDAAGIAPGSSTKILGTTDRALVLMEKARGTKD